MIVGENVKQVNVMDEVGRIVKDINEVCEKWKQYYEGVFIENKNRNAEIRASSGTLARLFG